MDLITIKTDLTLDDFKEMQTIEAEYYSAEYITPAIEAYRWHQHNPKTGIVAVCDGMIAGFLDVLPVNQDVFSQIIAGSLNDRELTVDHILGVKELLETVGQPVHLFFSCAVVRKKYRGSNVMKHMLGGLLNELEWMLHHGIQLKEVAGDCVTEDGERFMKKMGLSYGCDSDHRTRIYRGNFTQFYEKITQIASSVSKQNTR